jgi:hypothetical protein
MLAGEKLEATDDGDPARHVSTCKPCQERLEALEQQARRFPEEIGLDLLVRRTWLASHRSMVLGWGAAAAAIAALALVMVSPRGMLEDRATRTKGGFDVEIVARSPEGRVESVLPGGALHPNDAIRFIVSTDSDGFLIILGIDQASSVTVYAPQAEPTLALPAGRDHLIPVSVVLDETLGAEQIVALLCPEPVPLERAIAAGRAALGRAKGDPKQVENLGLGCRERLRLITKTRRD